jgi:SAM-dependent methyltransferase
MSMSSRDWDQRYQGSDLVWSATPNIWVEQIAGSLPPGTALDLAGGEGRNSIWLAERGWNVECVDFSAVALDRALHLAADRLGADVSRFHVQRADLLSMDCESRNYNLVLLVYFHLPAAERDRVLTCAAKAVAPGGRLLVVAHHSDNLAHGVGGPANAEVLYTEVDVQVAAEAAGLTTERAERALRAVSSDSSGEARNAFDVVYVGRRAE